MVKINGKWTYTDFTGGVDFNSKEVTLGTSCHGVPDKIEVGTKDLEDSIGDLALNSIQFDKSKIDLTLHVYDLNGNELKSQREPNGYSYTDSDGIKWTCTF